MRLDRTPFSWERCFDINGDSREHGQSDCEHEGHTERHDPDLGIEEKHHRAELPDDTLNIS